MKKPYCPVLYLFFFTISKSYWNIDIFYFHFHLSTLSDCGSFKSQTASVDPFTALTDNLSPFPVFFSNAAKQCSGFLQSNSLYFPVSSYNLWSAWSRSVHDATLCRWSMNRDSWLVKKEAINEACCRQCLCRKLAFLSFFLLFFYLCVLWCFLSMGENVLLAALFGNILL